MKISLVRRKPLLNNNEAISESFTVIPALAMVLIGFTIFSIIIASAYTTFDYHHDIINKFDGAQDILEKISSPNSPVTEDGSLFKLKDFNSIEAKEFFNQLLNKYQCYGYNFTIKLTFENRIYWIFNPQSSDIILTNTYACTKIVSIVINDIQIVPGSLTVIFWIQHTKQ